MRAHDLVVNIDLTIAMECRYLRGDVLDVSGTSLPVSSMLRPVSVVYDTKGFDLIQNHLQGSQKPLDLHRLINQRKTPSHHASSKDATACRYSLLTRFHGTFPVKAVKGMFHFTAVP